MSIPQECPHPRTPAGNASRKRLVHKIFSGPGITAALQSSGRYSSRSKKNQDDIFFDSCYCLNDFRIASPNIRATQAAFILQRLP